MLEKKKKRFTLCRLPAESTYEHFAAEKHRKYFYLGDTVIVSFFKPPVKLRNDKVETWKV